MFDFHRRINSFSSVTAALLEFHQFYMDESIDPIQLYEMMKRNSTQTSACFQAKASTSTKSNLGLD